MQISGLTFARERIARGEQQQLGYLIAVWTGLRRSEIEELVWEDIDLEDAVPRIGLRSDTTKSKRADTLVIHPELAEELRNAGYLARKQFG